MKRHMLYQDPEVFWQEISPALRAEEAKNTMLLGLSHNFRSDKSGCLYQGALFDGEHFLGALVCSQYSTSKVLLPSPVKQKDVAIRLLAEFEKAGHKASSLVGEWQTANLYRDLLVQAGRTAKISMRHGTFRCTHVKMPKAAANWSFRVAVLEDLPTVASWVEAFRAEAVPHDPPLDAKAVATQKIQGKMVYLGEDLGKPMAMACWSRDIGSSCSVNLVYTPKSSRGRGYGSFVTAKLTEFLLKGRVEINLFTDLENPTSNKIYQSIGYEYVCDAVNFALI